MVYFAFSADDKGKVPFHQAGIVGEGLTPEEASEELAELLGETPSNVLILDQDTYLTWDTSDEE